MITRNDAIAMARAKFAEKFAEMGASTARWDLVATADGVDIRRQGCIHEVLVPNVHALTEPQIVQKLHLVLLDTTPNIWSN